MSHGLACHRTSHANDGSDVDEGRLVLASLGLLESGYDPINVVTTIIHINNIPIRGPKPCIDVLGVCHVHGPIACHLVVVVDSCEIVQSPMSCQADGLLSDSLLRTCVANHDPGMIVYYLMTWLVVLCGQLFCRHRHSNCIGKTLT